MTLTSNDPNRIAASSASTADLMMGVLQMPQQLRLLADQLIGLGKAQERHREHLQQVDNKLAAAAQHDQNFSRQLDTLAAENARLARAVEALCQRQDVLEAASQQQRILTEQFFDKRVIEPLARWCIPIIDLIDEMQRPARSGPTSSPADPAAPPDAAAAEPALAEAPSSAADSTTLLAVRTQLLELLAAYGIEPCASSQGCTFDPKVMRPLAVWTTERPELEKTIARSLRAGWRRGDRPIRQECVILYRHQPPASPVPQHQTPSQPQQQTQSQSQHHLQRGD